MSQIADTLDFILKRILPDGTEVTVEEVASDFGVSLNINLAPEFIGQVIGKGGKTIKAIRLLLSLAYPNQRLNINLPDQVSATEISA
jgi:predicted RNA-binding protein YlqC (UPF0109 family)